MKIHRFSGMAQDYEKTFVDVNVTESKPWNPTRAAAFLAMLTEAYPEMTIIDVAAWAMANGLPDWEFSIDPFDSTLIPIEGNTIYFLDDYPLPENWKQLFADWKAGNYQVGKIPSDIPANLVPPIASQAVETVATAQTPEVVAATQAAQVSVAEVSQAQNQPVITIEETPASYVMPSENFTATSLTEPASTQSNDKMLWIVGAIVAAIVAAYLMKGKKSKKR